MKKLKENLTIYIDHVFTVINKSDERFLNDQSEKLVFLIDKINSGAKITTEEWDQFCKPFWYKKIHDPQRLSSNIDEIASLWKEDYHIIKLTHNEKVRLKRLKEVVSRRTLNSVDSLIIIESIRQKQLAAANNNLELQERLKNTEQKLELLREEKALLIKCRKLFELWKKDELTKLESKQLHSLENDYEVINYITTIKHK